MRINSLSDLTGVEILVSCRSARLGVTHRPSRLSQGKCEFLNPFGSVKDRVSLRSELLLLAQPFGPSLTDVASLGSHQNGRGSRSHPPSHRLLHLRGYLW